MAAVVAAALLAAGCGGEGDGTEAVGGELEACASRWNAERAPDAGAHAYLDHGARTALVTTIDVNGAAACAVVFAVPEGDPELGTVGEVVTFQGWNPINFHAPDPGALQRRGAAEANADVRPDGTVELR